MGDLPFSSSIGTSIEHVDMASGELQVTIPLFNKAGRHLDSGVTLYYSSNLYAVNTLYDTEGDVEYQMWSTQDRAGWVDNFPYVSATELQVPCKVAVHQTPTYAYYEANILYIDSSHNQHVLASQLGNGAGTCQNPSDSGPDTAAQGLWSPDTTHVLDSSGAMFNLTTRKLEDSNGNYITLHTPSSGAVDTSALVPYTLTTTSQTVNQTVDPLTWTYQSTDSNGVPQQYIVRWTSIPINTSFNVGPQEDNATTYAIAPTYPVISEIDLPNNQKYTFSYEPNYALLSQITLPNGGVIKYEYANYTDTSDLYNNGTRRYVTKRTEIVNGVTSEWDIVIPNSQGNSVSSKTTTVTLPGPPSHQTMLTAVDGSITDVKMYAGMATGTPLKEYTLTYTTDGDPLYDSCYSTYALGQRPLMQAAGRRLAQLTTTLDNGQSSLKTYSYDSFTYSRHSRHCNTAQAATSYTSSRGNVVEEDDYDWAPTGSTGALLKRITHTYLHDTSSNASAYVAANIVNRVASTTVYDGGGNVVSNTNYSYDDYSSGDGSLLSGTSSVPAHDYTAYSTANTLRGNITQVNRWLNTSSSWLRTSYGYDDLGNIISSFDPQLHQTTWNYTDNWSTANCLPTTGGATVDSRTYPTTSTVAAGTSIAETTTVSYYPCTGLKSYVRDPNDLANGRVGTHWAYDAIGRATNVTYDVGGGQESTVYTDHIDGINAGASYSTATRSIASDGSLSLTTVVEVDGLGRSRKTTVSTQGSAPVYSVVGYDAEGRKAQEWNPSFCDPDTSTSCSADHGTFGVTTHLFDALGRETLLIPADGTSTTNNASTSYSGNAVTTTDEAGTVRESWMDALGRLTQVSEGTTAYITKYSYDALGNLLCVEQHGNTTTGTGCSAAISSDASSSWRVRRFQYDSLSRLISAKNPENGQTPVTYTYDNDGNVLAKTDSRGIATYYSSSSHPIDALHRVTGVSYSDSTPASVYSFDAGVNGIGHRTGMNDGAGSSTFTYDAMGRLLGEQRTMGAAPGVTKSMGWEYNLDGSQKTITYPSGNVVTVSTGDRGHVVSVTDSSNNYAQQIVYNGMGQVTAADYGVASSFTGIHESNVYNQRSQPVTLAASTASATLMSLSYDFHVGSGNNGNLYQSRNDIDGSRTANYTYDGLNRILTASSDTWGMQYAIDPWGNLTGTTALSGKTNAMPMPADLTAGTDNRLQSTLAGYSYGSAGGNLTYANGSAYTWDGESRITAVAGSTYSYDGDGVRVEKASSTGGTYYWGQLAESDLAGNITHEYIFASGKRIARRDIATGAVYYYLSDNLGSSNVVVNSSGSKVNESDYLPYGGEQAVTLGLADQHFKYTGKERDAESGLDYFGARYLTSGLGRWMSPDWSAKADPVPYAKLNDPQTLNLYAYVGNSPVARVDADGHAMPRALKPFMNGDQLSAFTDGAMASPSAEEQSATATIIVYFEGETTGANAPAQQQVSQAGIDFIKGQEGWNGVLDKKTGLWLPKDDGFGNGTIGWGHNCGKCAGFAGGITKAQGDALLTSDLASYESSVSRITGGNASQQQFDALVSFAFNVKSYQGSTLMHNAAAGLPVTEANFTAYGNARNAQHVLVPVPGLMRRREQEWDVYANGDYSGHP
ncbi:glycoside hydrolase family protein [Granulicella cerasi]|uniref:Lysozyme n=1 Tax=Granulicella cerasi TaxID=741063 RepID=A0ABW1Z5H7_9BACT|nr:RHS repeat-associated core domain-containing protein [Granulicella cerasi]